MLSKHTNSSNFSCLTIHISSYLLAVAQHKLLVAVCIGLCVATVSEFLAIWW